MFLLDITRPDGIFIKGIRCGNNETVARQIQQKYLNYGWGAILYRKYKLTCKKLIKRVY